jgi:hypothetical protein
MWSDNQKCWIIWKTNEKGEGEHQLNVCASLLNLGRKYNNTASTEKFQNQK